MLFRGKSSWRRVGCAPGEEGEVGSANVRKKGTYECDGAGFVYGAKTVMLKRCGYPTDACISPGRRLAQSCVGIRIRQCLRVSIAYN